MPSKHRKDSTAGSHTCGDAGGKGARGPCRRETAKGTKCWYHGGDGPQLLTKELTLKISGACRAGSYFDVAARAHGVSERTARDWMQKGEKEPAGPYGEFYREVEEARAYSELSLVAGIRKAGVSRKVKKVRVGQDGKVVDETTTEEDGDWRANAFLLERSRPNWKRDLGSQNKPAGDATSEITITDVQYHYPEEEEPEENGKSSTRKKRDTKASAGRGSGGAGKKRRPITGR